MDGLVHTQSPIAWPKSDKKRKPFTPEGVTREVSGKLSSKKKNTARCQPSTPTGALLKWPRPSRSSMETFQRVYNEMTNSPTEKQDTKNSSPYSTNMRRMIGSLQSSPALAQNESRASKLQRCSSNKNLNCSPVSRVRRSKSLASLNPILILSSDDDDDISSKLPTTATTRRRLVIDSSSDDDSFCLPPPLHERLVLSSNKGPYAKPATNKPSRGKENNPRLKSQVKKSIVFDDSSSSESALSDLLKKKLDIVKVTAKPIVFDDSSEDELPDLQHRNLTPQPSSSTWKTRPVTEPRSFRPKPSCAALPHQLSPQNKDPAVHKGLNLWMSKESLGESSRFLQSLSDSSPVAPATAHFRNKFSKHKEDLVKELYRILNRTVFESKLAPDMSITWNIRLTKTAGFCFMRTHRDQTRTARIELSTKVLDSAERVRDTLLHELCHAAAFIIHGYRDGHGPLFKLWGQKAGILFPFLPVVSRCHTYQINTKYTYRCTKCKATIGRHSRSVDISKKGCGRCGGRFELLVNGITQASAQKKTPEFARFVKDYYKEVKQANKEMNHAAVMQKLGEMFTDKTKL